MKSLAPIKDNNDLVTKQYCDNNFIKIDGGGTLIQNLTKNLIRNSWKINLDEWDWGASIWQNIILDDGSVGITRTGAWRGASLKMMSDIEVGKTYTYSFYMHGVKGLRVDFYSSASEYAMYKVDKCNVSERYTMKSSKERIYFTFTVKDESHKQKLKSIRAECATDGGTLTISKPQLEEGELTDYFPNINEFIK